MLEKMYDIAKSILRKVGLIGAARKLREYFYILEYYIYHKWVFQINNTKFDISYCVFRESFLDDQYAIRKFIDRVKSSKEIFFLDIGRNHGFVFYYTMYHIMKNNISVSAVNYYGIDPSPLKFVYFNFHDYLSKRNIKINYHIIDRAIVFNGEAAVTLKYGENNFGNFHVSGSNYAERSKRHLAKFEFVEICVETMQFSEVLGIIDKNIGSDAVIVKIDCKNRTDYMFTEILEKLSACKTQYLISCEHDDSSGRDVSAYINAGGTSLSASNVI